MFKYIDRNKENTISLIPGWATDYRIFDSLELDFNYLIPEDFDPYSFEEEFLNAMRETGLERISLLGWSLGGFVAAEFSSKHPDLVDELILVSIRRKYKDKDLAEIKNYLLNSKTGFLCKFYDMCFCDKDRPARSKRGLLEKYCDELELDYLFKTLGYLKNARIKPKSLNGVKKIIIIHGENDNIAPVNEAISIKDRLKNARFIRMKDTGHMPFLKEEFSAYI